MGRSALGNVVEALKAREREIFSVVATLLRRGYDDIISRFCAKLIGKGDFCL